MPTIEYRRDLSPAVVIVSADDGVRSVTVRLADPQRDTKVSAFLSSIEPTAAEVDAAKEVTLDRMDTAILRELFDLRNEVRTLQGKATLTAAQFRQLLKAKLPSG